MDYNTIRERYYYEDGALYYRENLSPRARKGQRVGSLSGNGRNQLKYNNRTYSLPRVIYCYFNEVGYDDLPSKWDIDHLNNDINDNRIENLCLCEHWENQQNRIDTKRNGCLWKDNPIRLERNNYRSKRRYHLMSKADKDIYNKRCSERRRQRKRREDT